MGHPKRKLVFQPSIFRCYVSFREGMFFFWFGKLSEVFLLLWIEFDRHSIFVSKCFFRQNVPFLCETFQSWGFPNSGMVETKSWSTHWECLKVTAMSGEFLSYQRKSCRDSCFPITKVMSLLGCSYVSFSGLDFLYPVMLKAIPRGKWYTLYMEVNTRYLVTFPHKPEIQNKGALSRSRRLKFSTPSMCLKINLSHRLTRMSHSHPNSSLFFPCFTVSTIPIFHFFHWIHAAEVQPDISTRNAQPDDWPRFRAQPGKLHKSPPLQGSVFKCHPLSVNWEVTMASQSFPDKRSWVWRNHLHVHSHVYHLHNSVYKRHTMRVLFVDRSYRSKRETEPNKHI